MPASSGIFDDDVFDGMAADIVVAAQISACAQQAAERAVIECG
jgi:hypothetical protein